LWLALHSALASAGVTLDDPVGCLDAERLELELGLLLGDVTAARLDVRVTVEAPEQGRLAVHLAALDGGQLRWGRQMSATLADCDALPDAIALSVQQGLAGMGGWSATSRAPAAMTRLWAGLSVAEDPRARVDLERAQPLGGAAIATVGLHSELGGPLAVGAGHALLASALLSAGVERDGGLRPSLSVNVGPAWAWGLGFPEDYVAPTWRGTVSAQLATQLAGRPIAAGLEGVWMRVALLEAGADTKRVEPALRVVLRSQVNVRPTTSTIQTNDRGEQRTSPGE